jgi:hypothetical protein
MSSSFRIREAPAIPARVARLRSSATVMSSMLRATSAPSPIVPSTCAVATPVPRPLITRPSGAPLDPRGRGLAPCSRSPSAFAWSRLHREGTARRGERGADRRLEGPGHAVLAVAHAGANRSWLMEHRIEESWPRRSGGRAPIRAVLSRARPRSRALDCWRMPPRSGSAPASVVVRRRSGDWIPFARPTCASLPRTTSTSSGSSGRSSGLPAPVSDGGPGDPLAAHVPAVSSTLVCATYPARRCRTRAGRNRVASRRGAPGFGTSGAGYSQQRMGDLARLERASPLGARMSTPRGPAATVPGRSPAPRCYPGGAPPFATVRRRAHG